MAEDRMLSDEVLLALINKNSGGGGGGTDDYNDLKNQPKINNNTLVGNNTASDLGLVAAEAGKGLSTNDYTNADKAIVGGVTAALANKADKSAVKNEFIGTLAQWNALTTAQKKAYDTYQITDDYTEGSGGLPNYSTTEQLTGQKWIDGKDVYFKTYQTTTTPNVDNYIDLTSANIDKIISNDGTFFIDASGNQAVAQYFNSSDDRLQMYYDVANKRLVIRSVSSALTVYVTLKYTKA